MFRIKICGLRTLADAEAVLAAGGDAIGLNFFARSPRFVERSAAAEIARQTLGKLCRVGLFVGAAADEVCRTFDELELDLIQLHGDEPPEYLAQLGGRPVMKAFRLAGEDLEPITAYLTAAAGLNAAPQLVLLDAFRAGQFGGTGATVDWPAARRLRELLAATPLVLAGGLVPENVAAAIHAVGPQAVDTASGVESQPGQKDAARIAAFVAAARAGFATRPPSERERT
ncbi:MAG: phosphoribosylanthranilate isomerase [Pirellulales bacterium]